MTFEIGDEVIVRKAFHHSFGPKMRVQIGEKGVCTNKSSMQDKGKIKIYYEFVFTSTPHFGTTNSQRLRVKGDVAHEKLVKIGAESRQQPQATPTHATTNPAPGISGDKYELTIVSYGQKTPEVDFRSAIEIILADAYYPGGEEIRRLEGHEISDAIRSKTPLGLGRFPIEMSRNAKKEIETLGGQVTLVLVKA